MRLRWRPFCFSALRSRPSSSQQRPTPGRHLPLHRRRQGNIAAGALLGFFLEEIGPSVYNKGVADAQERLQQRVLELDYEVHQEEFDYWRKYGKERKGRK